MRLVLASNNQKKLAELQALLAPSGVRLLTQGSLDVVEADEPFDTFIENALTKARHAAQATGEAAIADDSGLCVAALGGAPGVHSAHYATIDAGTIDPSGDPRGDREARRARQDAANNALLLQRLAGVADRRAHFISTLVALRRADDPEPLIAVGRWHAEVATAASGEGGFGYDPLVRIAALGASVAQLPAAVKNTHSHRALAAEQMLRMLREVWRLG